jgi:hypothetical protein
MNIPIKEDLEITKTSTAKDGGDLKDNHAVELPSNYTLNPPIHMPHIAPQGPPPMLDASNFPKFKFLMNSHIHNSSIELWRIIKEGYKPHEPKNITQQEVVDDQLNATVLHMIHVSVNPKDCTRAHYFKTTKEAWDHLLDLFLGNGNIQSSKFD